MKAIDVLLICAVLAALALAVRRVAKNCRRGCGGDCAGCGLCDGGRRRP